jgi:dienelactone hydrolase
MRVVSLLLLIVLLSACAFPTVTPLPGTSLPSTPITSVISTPEALTGSWIGAATQPSDITASIILNFDDSTLNIEPLTATWKMNVTQSGEAVNFSASGKTDDPFRQIAFAGTFENGYFKGNLNWDGTSSEILFTHLVSVDASVLEKYEGLYRFESGRVLSIIVSPNYSSGGLNFFSQTLMMTDFESGALRGLYPFEEYTFAVGSLRVAGAPFDGKIQFIADDRGNTTGLIRWDHVSESAPSSTSGQLAKRVQYKYEDITFTSADGTKLAGRISLPESDSPIPAFMMLHGSEPGTRDNFGNKVMAHYMLSHGFAILNYDKRGAGESEGVYQEAASEGNLQKQAEDAIAGVKYLASRPEIDVKRIGLIGFSQAGWVIPLAASQSKAVTHIVILSGPVASTSHEDIFSNYTNDGDTLTNYDDAKITQQLYDLKPSGFDPLPIIATLKQPGLWLWGSVDKSVPVTFSAENLQALINSGKNNFSYQVFPSGDHNLNISPNGLFAEIPYSPGVLFYSTLENWLELNISSHP